MSAQCEQSTCRPITIDGGEPVPAVDLPLSFKNLSEDGLYIFSAFPLHFKLIFNLFVVSC